MAESFFFKILLRRFLYQLLLPSSNSKMCLILDQSEIGYRSSMSSRALFVAYKSTMWASGYKLPYSKRCQQAFFIFCKNIWRNSTITSLTSITLLSSRFCFVMMAAVSFQVIFVCSNSSKFPQILNFLLYMVASSSLQSSLTVSQFTPIKQLSSEIASAQN